MQNVETLEVDAVFDELLAIRFQSRVDGVTPSTETAPASTPGGWMLARHPVLPPFFVPPSSP